MRGNGRGLSEGTGSRGGAENPAAGRSSAPFGAEEVGGGSCTGRLRSPRAKREAPGCFPPPLAGRTAPNRVSSGSKTLTAETRRKEGIEGHNNRSGHRNRPAESAEEDRPLRASRQQRSTPKTSMLPRPACSTERPRKCAEEFKEFEEFRFHRRLIGVETARSRYSWYSWYLLMHLAPVPTVRPHRMSF